MKNHYHDFNYTIIYYIQNAANIAQATQREKGYEQFEPAYEAMNQRK